MNWLYTKLRSFRFVRVLCLRIAMPYARRPVIVTAKYFESSREWSFVIRISDEAIADGQVVYFDPAMELEIARKLAAI